jgi:uncharacterized protein YbjT (DUF2867 family)
VCGATGRQGGAVARSLLSQGWRVRALTRDPSKARASALARAGAEVVAADMDEPATLRRAFTGVDGVYSVQNGLVSGFDREVEQGGNVAEAADAAAVDHVVYGSAGTGQAGTGIASWEAKLRVEARLAALGVPTTVLRPQAFMELMTDPSFYPAVGTWRIWPRLSGEQQVGAWLAVEDLGEIAAIAFSRRDEFVGRDMRLASDLQTLQDCRRIYREVVGRAPRTFPMPVWLFDRFTRGDITAIWRWLPRADVEFSTEPTRSVLPTAMTVREYLTRHHRDPEAKEERQ